jgi:hypothetical protein
MRALFYDHELSDPANANADYYISSNYCDDVRRDDENYSYIKESSEITEFFMQATEDLSDFSNERFSERTIKEIISFQGISLWWFYEIAIRIKYIQYLKYRQMLNAFLDKTSISSMICCINDSILLSAAKECCAERKIPLEVMPGRESRFNRVKLYSKYAEHVLGFFLDLIISRFYGRKRDAQVVIGSYTRYWTRFNITKESPKDGIFQDIEKMLSLRKIKYIGIEYRDESLKKYIATRMEKRKYARGEWIPLSTFTTMRILVDSLIITRNLVSSVSKLSFQDSNYKFILSHLADQIKTSYFLISEILSMKNALKFLQPKAMLTSCEYCKMGRAATIAANQATIPTVALQHGIITPVHWGYIFSSSDEVSFHDAVNCRPIPLYTLIYGPGYQDLLLNKSTYPPESLVVTGQPRYDHLYHIAMDSSKEDFMKKHNISSPLIVWTSQGDLPEQETMENINCFLGLIKSIPEITLFIKPHPNEEDFSIYEPLTRCKNVVLSRDVDLYKLLNACDIMITKNSTTAMEAAALDKPVIVLNLSRIPDVVDYVKEGIAVGVYKSEDLPPRVKALLKDESELESSRKGYIKKYLYKVDGRSSDRVAEFMANLIN